jgi:iron complex outermembrane recepter protein
MRHDNTLFGITTRCWVGFGSLVLAATIAAPIGAQQGTDTSSVSGGRSKATEALTEIVVTAEKRQSTVQNTPISITAISGEDLQERGLTSVEDVARETPGISFRSAGPGLTEFEMRGISSTGGSVGTTGFYVDETPITPPSFGAIGKVVIDPNLYDLQSIEVLRGPQGTLYGAGSMGGTVRLLTNAPKLNDWDANVQATGSYTDGGGFNRGGNLMINIPIAPDLLAARLVLSSQYTDGWLDRIVENGFPYPSNVGCPPSSFLGCTRGNVAAEPYSAIYRRVNWNRIDTIRPSLLFAPMEGLSVNLSSLYQRTTAGGYSQIDIPPGCDSLAPCGHYQPDNVAEPFYDLVKLLSAVVKYDMPYVQLTSATSYWSRDERQTGDGSEVLQNTVGYLFGLPYVPVAFPEEDHSEQFSTEFRLTSKGDSPFQWIGGVFFSSFHYSVSQDVTNPSYANLIPPNPDGLILSLDYPYDTKQYAIFGEASYKLSPDLKFTLGARGFKYQSEADGQVSGVVGPTGTTVPYSLNGLEQSARGINPKANLSYQPSDELTVYATASKGFRPGGISEPIPLSGPDSCLPSLQAIGRTSANITYGPDSLWNYELGEKARLNDGRLQINADVYYIKWKGIQQVVPLSCGYLLEANAGEARSYGPEIEVTARLAPGLTFNVNGAYTNAEINNPAPFSGASSGQPLLNIPKYTTSASLMYDISLPAELKLTPRLTESVVGPQWDVSYADERLPSYAITDFRLAISQGRWAVTAFVSNLTNKMAILTINNTNFIENMPAVTRATVSQPRTVGLQFDYHVK